MRKLLGFVFCFGLFSAAAYAENLTGQVTDINIPARTFTIEEDTVSGERTHKVRWRRDIQDSEVIAKVQLGEPVSVNVYPAGDAWEVMEFPPQGGSENDYAAPRAPSDRAAGVDSVSE